MLATFCSFAVLKIALISVTCGSYFGYSVGYFGPYVTLTKTSQNCPLYQSDVACNTLTRASCQWNTTGNQGACVFQYPCATLHSSRDTCKADKRCTYDEQLKACVDPIGYDATELGILSGASIAGSMVSSLCGGFIIGKIGVRYTLVAFGLVAIIGSIMTHISRATDTYPLLVVGRVLIGTASGIACVGCPMYCDAVAPANVRNAVGALFGISIPFGILIAALLGLLLDPDALNNSYTEPLYFEARLQVMNGFSTFFSLAFLLVAFIIPPEFGKKISGDDMESSMRTPTWLSMMRPLLVSVVLSIAQQFTGINAIINYAPIITTAMRLKPLVGNFLIGLWNFLTAILSIFAASRMTLRHAFLFGVFMASASTLITGIPVLPGVASEIVRNVFAGIGVFSFILVFECFVGPPFYIVSQQLFPASFRRKGSSWTIGVQYLMNLIINVCFPIAVTNLSGGPGGDQNLGLGIVFIFFCVCGVVTGLILVKFLHPVTDDDSEAPKPPQAQNDPINDGAQP